MSLKLRVTLVQVKVPLQLEHHCGYGICGRADVMLTLGISALPMDVHRLCAVPAPPYRMLLIWMRILLCIYKYSCMKVKAEGD